MEQEFSDKKTVELWKSRMTNDSPIIVSDVIGGTVYNNEELDIMYAFTIDTHGIARISKGKEVLAIWSERSNMDYVASADKRFKKKLIVEVSVDDLENFIEEHLGQTIEIVPSLELNNDSEKSMNVEPKIDVSEREELEDWLKTGNDNYGTTGIILNHMCLRGLIDKGEYILKYSY